ncbi:hypothetical protein [Pantanalinema sp. GBBB05]
MSTQLRLSVLNVYPYETSVCRYSSKQQIATTLHHAAPQTLQ